MTFTQYPDYDTYKFNRNQIAAQFENFQLYSNGGKNRFYGDGKLNIGFGFNITDRVALGDQAGARKYLSQNYGDSLLNRSP